MSYTSSVKITLSVLVFAVLVFLAWYLLRPSVPAEPTAPIGSTDSTSFGNAGMVTRTSESGENQTASTQQSQPLLEIGQAYVAMYISFGAVPAVFNRVHAGSSGDEADIYSLYAKDREIAGQMYPSAQDLSIAVAMVDITGDGSMEAMVYHDMPGFCGTGGCDLDIYTKQQNKWVKVFTVFAASNNIGISNTLTQGYVNLYIPISKTGSPQTAIVRYDWDGTTYQEKLEVAEWNGTIFTRK